MKKFFQIFFFSFLFVTVIIQVQGRAQQPGPKADGGSKVLLSNGWSLTPAGHSLPLGDLPLNIAVSPSKRWLAVTNNGQSTQTLQLIDAVNEKIVDRLGIPKSWLGWKLGEDGQFLYSSAGKVN